jgi:hypothetical protein
VLSRGLVAGRLLSGHSGLIRKDAGVLQWRLARVRGGEVATAGAA